MKAVIYPSSTAGEKRFSLTLQLIKFPFYLFGLTYATQRFWAAGTNGQALLGPNWYYLYGVCLLVALFGSKLDILVALLKGRKFLERIQIPTPLSVAAMTLLPLICALLEGAYYSILPNNMVILVSSGLASPMFGWIGFGCYKGIVDPYWPSAFRKMLKERKAKLASGKYG